MVTKLTKDNCHFIDLTEIFESSDSPLSLKFTSVVAYNQYQPGI